MVGLVMCKALRKSQDKVRRRIILMYLQKGCTQSIYTGRIVLKQSANRKSNNQDKLVRSVGGK